jgi:hypothetical protein
MTPRPNLQDSYFGKLSKYWRQVAPQLFCGQFAGLHRPVDPPVSGDAGVTDITIRESLMLTSDKSKPKLGFASKPSKPPQDFNPGRFLSGLTEAHYPKGFSPNASVLNKRDTRVDWLIKKRGDDDAAMDLADRLDNFERKIGAARPHAPFAPTLLRRSPPRSRSSF